jgi:plastocyanin
MRAKRIRIRSSLAAIAVLAVMGAACASNSSATSGGSGSTPPSAAGGGYGGGYGGGSKGGGGGSTSGSAAATVKQGAGGQLAFSPSSLTVKKGDAILVDDVASIPHTFTIDGQGIDVANDGGQNQTVSIDLNPGTYTFICRYHVGVGMKGTLTVTG